MASRPVLSPHNKEVNLVKASSAKDVDEVVRRPRLSLADALFTPPSGRPCWTEANNIDCNLFERIVF